MPLLSLSPDPFTFSSYRVTQGGAQASMGYSSGGSQECGWRLLQRRTAPLEENYTKITAVLQPVTDYRVSLLHTPELVASIPQASLETDCTAPKWWRHLQTTQRNHTQGNPTMHPGESTKNGVCISKPYTESPKGERQQEKIHTIIVSPWLLSYIFRTIHDLYTSKNIFG